MAITISGENNNDRITAQDGVIDTISGFNISGIITASSFTGDLTGDVTGNVTGNINNSTLLLQTGSTERVRITSDGKISTGALASPDGNLHVYSSSAGSVTAASDAKELVLESATNVGMSFLTATNSISRIKFGDSRQSNRGVIAYNHSIDSITFHTVGNERSRITSGGDILIGRNSGLTDAKVSIQCDAGESGIAVQLNTTTGTSNLLQAYSAAGPNVASITVNPDATPDLMFNVWDGSSTAERLRITSAGRIGIGTNFVDAQLKVRTAGVNQNMFMLEADMGTNNNRSLYVMSPTTDSASEPFTFHTGNSIQFMTDANIGLKIHSDGKVGIGTNNPTKLLEIFGTDPTIKLMDSSGDAYALIEADSADQGSLRFRADPLDAGSGTHIRFDTDGDERLRIDSTGRILIGHDAASSDLHDPQTTYNRAPFFQLHGENCVNAGAALISWKNSAGAYYAPALYLAHSGSDTIGTNSILPASGEFGSIVFSGDDGTDFVKGAMIKARIDGTPGTDDMPGRLEFHTTPDGAQVPVERLRIDSAGKIGISRTPTQHPLEIQHASEPTVSLWRGSTKGAALQAQSGGTYLYSYENAPILFSVNSGNGFTERLRITSTGLIYVGGDGTGGRIDATAGDGSMTFSDGNGRQTLKISTMGSGQSTAHIFDANGRLLTGGATTSHGSTNADDLQIGANNQSNQTGITLGSASASSIRFADAADDTAGAVYYGHADNIMRFYAGSNQRFYVNGTNATASASIMAATIFRSGGPGGGLGITMGGLAAGSGSSWVDTGISVNASNGGRTMMILGSRNTGAGYNTQAYMWLIRFAYDGNNLPSVHNVTGNSSFWSIRVSGSNTLEINGNSGNWQFGGVYVN